MIQNVQIHPLLSINLHVLLYSLCLKVYSLYTIYTRHHFKNSLSIHPPSSTHILILPVAVIVIGIVTSQSSETAQADGIREEDLGSSVHPYLKKKWA